MSEKKVYAMAPEGGQDYIVPGKVYLTRPSCESGNDKSCFEYFDDDCDEPWAFSNWEYSSHLNDGNWTRLELTEEEADAINAKLSDPLDSHPNSEPDADECSVVADTIAEWPDFPHWANFMVQRDDGRVVAFECRPVIFGGEWVSEEGAMEHMSFHPVIGDWRKRIMQKEPVKKISNSTSDASTAVGFLESALGHMRDREATYDAPGGERSMGKTVAAFNAVTGCELTEEQGWLFMVLLKAVRTQQGGFRADNYEDGAAYFGLQGEAAHRERG